MFGLGKWLCIVHCLGYTGRTYVGMNWIHSGYCNACIGLNRLRIFVNRWTVFILFGFPVPKQPF
jgi:hypothetical protein